MAALSRNNCILGDMLPDACMKASETNLMLRDNKAQEIITITTTTNTAMKSCNYNYGIMKSF